MAPIERIAADRLVKLVNESEEDKTPRGAPDRTGIISRIE